MTRKQTTKRLANALYSVSEQNNLLDSVHRGLNTLNILMKTDSQFRVFIQSKRISGEDKTTILNNVMGDLGHPLVGELLSHIQGRQSSTILQDVINLFTRRYNEGKNIDVEIKNNHLYR